MACQSNVIVLQTMSLMVNERPERSGMLLSHCGCTQNLIYKKNFYRLSVNLFFHSHRKSPLWSKHGWRIAFALNTDGFTANNEQANLNGDNSSFGGTRLSRIVGAGGRQLLNKLNSARKNFPMKVFLLLFGFYTANALATILGQTGDWDVLVAGLVVAVIEGIGMLMYRKPAPSGRLQYLLVLINYWKAGVCLGLFVDAFKLGS